MNLNSGQMVIAGLYALQRGVVWLVAYKGSPVVKGIVVIFGACNRVIGGVILYFILQTMVICEVVQNLKLRRRLQRIHIIGFIPDIFLHTQLDQLNEIPGMHIISDDVVR